MKKIRIVMFILLTCIFMTLGPINVFAVSDIDNSKEKSLSVYFYTQKVGVDTPIEGAEIGVSKIADITVKNGNIEYNVLSDYAELRDTKFEGITVDESKEIAKRFDEIVETNNTKVTDKDGLCKFTISENGVYLVKHISSTGDAERYTMFEPYIILVPYVSEVNTDWKYEVLSEPKTTDIQLVESEVSEESGGSDVSDSSDGSTASEISSAVSDSSTISEYQSYRPVSKNSFIETVLTGDTIYSIILACIGLICLSTFLILILNRKEDK